MKQLSFDEIQMGGNKEFASLSSSMLATAAAAAADTDRLVTTPGNQMGPAKVDFFMF